MNICAVRAIHLRPEQWGFSRSPVTCTVLHWIHVFTRLATVEIVLDSLRFLQDEGLHLYAYVILDNHLHIVQSTGLNRDLTRFNLKKSVDRSILIAGS
jgi:hypothetical protein